MPRLWLEDAQLREGSQTLTQGVKNRHGCPLTADTLASCDLRCGKGTGAVFPDAAKPHASTQSAHLAPGRASKSVRDMACVEDIVAVKKGVSDGRCEV